MNKKAVQDALKLYYLKYGLNTPEKILANLAPAFSYLLKLKLVKAEWYHVFKYAAETQYQIYRSRK